jgi:Reverse transcriptase (RNA-dependent DNA polymerase)
MISHIARPAEPASREVVQPQAAAEPTSEIGPTLRRARKQQRKLQRQIEKAEAKGRHAEARWLQRKLLRSFSARLVGTDTANRRLPRHRRAPQNALPEIAASLNAWRGTREPVRVRGEPKRGGDVRPISSFGLQNRALEYLVIGALEPLAQLHPGQHMVRGGGRRAASAKVMRLMQEGYKWVISFDVADCYPSFAPDGVANCLPLPRRVTEACVVSRNMNMVVMNGPSLRMGVSLLRRSRQGIPQGSAASPLVAEMLLAKELPKTSQGVEVVTIADDILVFTRTKAEADAILTTLPAAFAQHPAGSLRLKQSGPRRVCDGFDFIGYRFRTRYGRAIAKPSDWNEYKFRMLFNIDFARARTSRDFARLQQYVKSWCAAFELWDAATACREVLSDGLQYAARRKGIL